MAKRNRFPDEEPTDPERSAKPLAAHTSGRAPKSKRERAEAPTLPPPKSSGKGAAPKSKRTEPSIPRPRPRSREKQAQVEKPAPSRRHKGASIDEVVADLSKDPRRDED